MQIVNRSVENEGKRRDIKMVIQVFNTQEFNTKVCIYLKYKQSVNNKILNTDFLYKLSVIFSFNLKLYKSTVYKV